MPPASPTVSQLLYVSQSLVAHGDELVDIVTQSRERNARCGITGGLLFTGGYFAQILEGGWAEIDEVMRSITHDYRHTRVTVLLTRSRAERDFARWTMAFNEYPDAEGTIGPLVDAQVASAALQRMDSLLALMYQQALLSR